MRQQERVELIKEKERETKVNIRENVRPLQRLNNPLNLSKLIKQ